MSTPQPPGRPPSRVPTLTEIVELPGALPAAAAEPAATPAADAPPAERRSGERRAGWATPDEEALVQRVLADVQRQVDLMLEVRLREVLAPVLARTTDALVRDARAELASTLREVVTRAVTQEISRHRRGPGER